MYRYMYPPGLRLAVWKIQHHDYVHNYVDSPYLPTLRPSEG